MQRKNNILKTSKNGIAMIMAIITLLIIASIMALSMSMTIATTKRTTDMYLYEQSVLLSNSAVEYAMLRMSQAANPCSLATIPQYTYNGIYTINTSMQYLSNNGSDCDTNSTTTLATLTYVDPADPTIFPSDGSVIIDVTVEVLPANAGTTEPIRYFRRSVGKL